MTWMSAWPNWALRCAAPSIMVHIFHQEERQFYNLERLWEDGNNRLVLPFDQTIPD